MFPLSWAQALFPGETLETSLERLARCGYDGVELPLSSMLPAEIRGRLAHHGLACTSVNGGFIGPDRDLSSADPDRRRAAVAHVRNTLRYAAELRAPVALVVPTRIGKMKPETSLAADWDSTLHSLREIGETGRALGVTAVIECVNRAESHLANRLETAALLVRQSGAPNLAVMADLFHMNIEEADPLQALRDVAPHLAHVHLADNNRAAPGMGHLDIAAFVRVLKEIGYRGALAMECDVQARDAYGRMAASRDPALFDLYAETAIQTLHPLLQPGA